MKKILLFVVLLTGFRCISYGQVNDSDATDKYEYMTIISEFPDKQIYLIYITAPNGKYEKQIINDRRKYDKGETTYISDLLEKYENLGWSLHTNNMLVRDNDYVFYFLLKRKKN